MNSTTANKVIDSYFRVIKNWDTEAKKNLIVKLTRSINAESSDKAQRDFSACFGAWEDDRSAEEIASEIRASRVNNRKIEDFE